MSVFNTIDLVGVSDQSWGQAAREALREAAKTIRRISKMDVLGTACKIDESGTIEYQTTVRLYFEVEPART